MSEPVLIQSGETVDRILGGPLRIIQKEKGCRFSIDALLLSHFIRLREDDSVLDLGTGGGIIPMILAQRWPRSRFTGLDIQHDLIDMARRSLVLNAMTDRITLIRGDIRQVGSFLAAGCCDVVTFNPPYRRIRSGRVNPNVEKAIARHELRATLEDFLQAALHCLKWKGRVFLIYPAGQMVRLISRLRALRLEPKQMVLVYATPGSEGQFVLVEGVRGGNEAVKVLPPMVIYERPGVYTRGMQRIFSDLGAPPAFSAC